MLLASGKVSKLEKLKIVLYCTIQKLQTIATTSVSTQTLFSLNESDIMAEFCTPCATKWGMLAEIDPMEILKSLRPGEEYSVLCEGCGLICVRRNQDITVQFGYHKGGTISWVTQLEGLV